MATYRFLRWDITGRRGATDSIAVGEFQVRNSGGPVGWPSGTTATAKYFGSAIGEGPDKLIEGTSSQFRDYGFRIDSVIVFHNGGELFTFDAYRYFRAAVSIGYDPVSWTLSGSFDGSKYTRIDSRSLYDPLPTTNLDPTDTFTLPESVSFPYLRWTVTHIRQLGESASSPFLTNVSATEFELLLDGTPLDWDGTVVVTNPGGTNPPGQGPGELADNEASASSTFFDSASKTNGGTFTQGLTQVTIDCGSGNSVTFNGYRWATGTGSDLRDPTAWKLYGSNDGTSWDLLDTHIGSADIPTARNTYTAEFPIGKVDGTLGEQQIIGTQSVRFPTRPGNLLADPSFENGISGWTAQSGLLLAQWKSGLPGIYNRTGFAGMAMYNTGSPLSIEASSPLIPITGGKVYEVTAWFTRDSSHGLLGGVSPSITWYRNGAWAGNIAGESVKAVGGQFKLIRVNARAPIDATHLEFGIAHVFPSTGDFIVVDDVHIGESAATTTFSGGSPTDGALTAVGPAAEGAFTAQIPTDGTFAVLGPNAEAAFAADQEGAALFAIGPNAEAAFVGDTIPPNEAALAMVGPTPSASLAGDPAHPDNHIQPVDVRVRRPYLRTRALPARWRE